MRSRGDILLRLKSRSLKEPRSLISAPLPPFSLPVHPSTPFVRLSLQSKIQTFTVLKHLWVRYNNNSSNIIFT